MSAPSQPAYYTHLSGPGLPVYPHPPSTAQAAPAGHSYLPAALLHKFSSSPPISPPDGLDKAKARDKKGKSVARPAKLKAATKGRKPGSKGYSDMEKLLLAKLVRKLKPIGLDRWKRVTVAYNKHAQKHDFASRETKGLRAKFESVSFIFCSTLFCSFPIQIAAETPPTGGGEIPDYLSVALEADEQITGKSQSIILDDDTASSDVSLASEAPALPIPPARSARSARSAPSGPAISVHGSSSDIEWPPSPPRQIKPEPSVDAKPSTKPKATRALNQPAPSISSRTRGPASAALLSNINTMFDPQEQQARDQLRFAQQLQLQQVAALQSEVQQLRAELGATKDKLHEEQRAADQLRFEIKLSERSRAEFPSSPLLFKSRVRTSRALDEWPSIHTPKRSAFAAAGSPMARRKSPFPIPIVSPISRRNATPGPSRPLAALPLIAPKTPDPLAASSLSPLSADA